MADVVRQAGDAADVQHLDAALRPVERYAVRFLLDNVLPPLDMEVVEATLQEQLQVEDLDVDAVEALEAEEEEEVCPFFLPIFFFFLFTILRVYVLLLC